MRTSATDYLMIRLSEGLVGWLGFQQAARRNPLYSEYLTYAPIFEMASGRGWNAHPQYPLPSGSSSSKGAPKTWDFLFWKKRKDKEGKKKANEGLAALEIKFIPADAQVSSFCKRIVDDISKLMNATYQESAKNKKDCGLLSRYIILVAQGNILLGMAKKCGTEQKLSMQISSVLSEDENSSIEQGWVRHSHGEPTWQFSVMVLREQPWWSSCTSQGATSLDGSDVADVTCPSDEYSSSSHIAKKA